MPLTSKPLMFEPGKGWVMGIPARDLMPLDLVEIEEREGISREDVLATGLYVEEAWGEGGAFCGQILRTTSEGGAKEDGLGFGEGRCREPVEQWGDRCEDHK